MKLKIFKDKKRLAEYTDIELQTKIKEEKEQMTLHLIVAMFTLVLAAISMILNAVLAKNTEVNILLLVSIVMMVAMVADMGYLDAIKGELRLREVISQFTKKEGSKP